MNREDGNLELLALGLLPEEEAVRLQEALRQDRALQEEYESIQKALEQLAMENALPAPEGVFEVISRQTDINVSGTKGVLVPFYKRAVFRLAASVLLFASLLTNIYLLTRSSDKSSVENPYATLVGELPLSTSDFDEMFDYLHTALSETPCKMDYTLTKAFLAEKGLTNGEELVKFLLNNGGHCDCEVLMNVSLRFPQDVYHHGNPIPENRKNGEIKVAQNHTYIYKGSLLASR